MDNLAQIKLVIWDLDDTFWKGTLSEENIKPVESHIKLVKDLTQRGIVNSICSKNDKEKVMKVLSIQNMQEFFVNVSINWEPKGERIQKLIKQMKLRAENVLFLDDNPLNLEEAKFYNPSIMTMSADEIGDLIAFVKKMPISDPQQKRLASYRLLESKREDEKNSSSNEAFLTSSNIKVFVHDNCIEQLERIAELIGRTNQLNYTKVRLDLEETKNLLMDPLLKCGYISVKDKYGDYGIVGFYAMSGRVLKHFLFSCRTLGMGVEQYVYAFLGFPELTTVGEVAVRLEPQVIPDWINQNKELEQIGRQTLSKQSNGKKILLKGPCDLDAIFSYIEESDLIDSEFTYVSPSSGVTIEQISHTSHIVQSLTLSQGQIDKVIEELPFSDPQMYSDKIFTGNYDVVCLSVLVDANLGVYKRKKTGEEVAFVQAHYPLTDPSNWDAYCSGEVYTSGCHFTREMLHDFSEKYEFMGALKPEQTVSNLSFIREHLSKDTLLLILLGSEIPYEKNKNPAYDKRHIQHQQMNRLIREFAAGCEHTKCIDVNHYLKGQDSFYDHLNHYVPSVYYAMSGELVRLIQDFTGHAILEKSKRYLWMQNLKAPLKKGKRLIKKMLRQGVQKPRS